MQLKYWPIFLVTLLLYALAIFGLAGGGVTSFTNLHLLIDTCVGVLSLLLAIFLLSEQYNITPQVRHYLVISFGFASFAEILHALMGIEWGGQLEWIQTYSHTLRPATWPVSTYVLPLALAWLLWRERSNALLRPGWFAAGLAAVTSALIALGWALPQYVDTGFLGIHRPTQIPLLFIWAFTIAMCWRARARHPLYEGLVWMGAMLFLSDLCMLYSTSPHERFAMMAHMGKLLAYLMLHTIQMRIAAADSKARKVAELELRLEKEHANASLEALQHQKFALDQHAIVSITDAQGRIIYANDKFCEISGYSRAELLGKDHRIIKSGEHPIEFFRDMYQTIAAGKVWHGEICNCSKDGHLYWVMSSIVPFVDKETVKPLNYIAMHTDITPRKNIETEHKHLLAILEASPEFIATATLDGYVLYISPGGRKMLGLSIEQDITATHISDYHPEWAARLVLEQGLPTATREGVWSGETAFLRSDGTEIPLAQTILCHKSADGSPEYFSTIAIDISAAQQATAEIKRLAYHDQLTRLPNRRLLLDRLQQALASSVRSGRQGALLFIDLDNFKTLNDTLGHDTGDLLLQQAAQRLVTCVRIGDTVSRIGGDEFVVMLEDLSEQAHEAAAQTEAIGEKIITALNQAYQLGAHECRITPSIGATLFNGQLVGIEELFKQSDIAMYQAKKAGRNTLCFYDPRMQEIIKERVALEGEIHTAIENQQFQLHYQIQVDDANRPFGAEALIRWLHPERGMVSPAQFIPLAEETGMILPIGQWVLETACAQLRAWQQDAHTRDLVLAVNVSAKQFRQTDFVAQVQAAVQRHAINPALLKLELTESMLLENIEETIATMNALNDVDVQFSLDDFGTGYSSLQYLKRLPLDQIKIDQSFVRDIATDSGDNAVVHAIISMAHSLELDVIAEGVETLEQRQLLLEKGCRRFQGYLFSKPVPIDQLTALLEQKKVESSVV